VLEALGILWLPTLTRSGRLGGLGPAIVRDPTIQHEDLFLGIPTAAMAIDWISEADQGCERVPELTSPHEPWMIILLMARKNLSCIPPSLLLASFSAGTSTHPLRRQQRLLSA
jgi:hypothetical protein